MRRKNKGVNITFSLYPTAGPRQQGAPNLARRRPILAPPRRQSLIPSSGHANRAPQIPPGASPCWRRPADNPLSHRRATPTGRPESRSAPAHVGAAPPITPYPTVGPRQQDASNLTRRRPMLAPPRRQPLIPPPGHANRACSSPEGPPRPGGPAPLPRRTLPAVLPPRSNRNLVGKAGAKAKKQALSNNCNRKLKLYP